MCVALIVDEVGSIGGHGPVEEAVLVHVASLTHHLQAVVVLTAHVINLGVQIDNHGPNNYKDTKP